MWYLIIFNAILIFSFLILWNNHKEEIELKYIRKRKKELEDEVDGAIAYKVQREKELNEHLVELTHSTQLAKVELAQVQEQKKFLLEELNDYEKQQREYLDHHIQILKEIKTNEALIQLEKERKQAEAEFECLRKEKQNEIDALVSQLQSFQAKQEAINQEILRRRELEEKTDFYRVCLSDEAITDITELQIVKQKLKKPEILDKIIYDTYVAKPVLEMIKRVLQNATCSGIYKITCQETKEIYIGKSTDIKNRWQQHCKTAFNCGTIASSLLHRKMQKYGIENFTFELLEAVPKDKLSEREAFYINFYKTKETGLNERNG